MSSTSRDARKFLQSRIDAGVFTNRNSLIAYGKELGWILESNSSNRVKFTFDGFIGSRKTFGVKVNFRDQAELRRDKEVERLKDRMAKPYSQSRHFFNEPYSRPDAQLRFVYILIATSQEKSAAYIGHSSTITKRLHGHLKRKIRGSSSGQLRAWANSENVPIRFCVVDSVFGDMTKAEATSLATNLEGLWAHRARRAGIDLPGVEGWGQFPKQIDKLDDEKLWNQAAEFAIDTDLIFDEKIDFRNICMASVPLDEIKHRYEVSVRCELEEALQALKQ